MTLKPNEYVIDGDVKLPIVEHVTATTMMISVTADQTKPANIIVGFDPDWDIVTFKTWIGGEPGPTFRFNYADAQIMAEHILNITRKID